MNGTLLTVKEAGKRMGLLPGMVFKLIEAGLVAHVKTAGQGLTFVPENALRGLKFDDDILALAKRRILELKQQKENSDGDHTQEK